MIQYVYMPVFGSGLAKKLKEFITSLIENSCVRVVKRLRSTAKEFNGKKNVVNIP
ncbi:MAG: hypothetical protein H3Z52_10190 [archaeon]|nr:hypothetical protein [archaeon]